MIRAVLDTNIWVSSILWQGNPYRIRKSGEKREVVLITSLAILAELTRVLREYFDFSDEESYEWHQRIGENTEVVWPTRWVNAVPDDADDNKFVECALEGRAQYIISRDDDLLRLKQYDDILIVDDREFVRGVQLRS